MLHLRSKVIQLVHGVSIHVTPHFQFAQYIVLACAGLFIILLTFFGQRPLISTRVHNACVPVCVSLLCLTFFVCVLLCLCAMSKY